MEVEIQKKSPSKTMGILDKILRVGPKPPIGIMPLLLWKEERFHKLKSVLQEHIDRNHPVKPEWIAEYNQLLEDLVEDQE